HSIELARRCSLITQVLVSTDSPDVAATAAALGEKPPFLRPAELARDDTAMWPVLRHALDSVEKVEARRFDYLLLLDPTSPFRLPEDIEHAFADLVAQPEADGIV